MLSHRLNCNIFSTLKTINRRLVTSTLQNEDEYNELPEYPPITDLSLKGRKQRTILRRSERVKMLSTVEEKLFELNMPKYYGWKSYMLNDEKFPYNTTPFTQFATRTHFEEKESLPDYYSHLNEQTALILTEIKSEIEDAIAFEFARHSTSKTDMTPEEKEELATSSLLQQLNRVLLNSLPKDYVHLREVETDLNPRHDAFWFLGGINPLAMVKKIKERFDWKKPYASDPCDRAIQYLGKPYLALRHKHPLKPLVDLNLEAQDAKSDGVDIPWIKHDPMALGYHSKYRHGTTVPGFWPGDQHEFGLISFQRRSHHLHRQKYCAINDSQEALHSQGMLSSYAWLFGQACYQGFSTYNDVTYPLNTQTVITNGQFWSFYAYQLNTTLLHNDHSVENNRYNQCWGTKEMKLFDAVDDSGKIHGLNDEVLLNLIKFYLNEPTERVGVDLKPYLCKSEPRIADILDDERRVWVESNYKNMVSNRPRHLLEPEIYNWEKIYKIDHRTRQLDAKRRFFELGIHPNSRRMNEHAATYIPKGLRPRGPRSRTKFEKTYYPEIRR